DVQPIFRQYCIGCHGAALHQAGLRLDRRSDAMRGGTTTPGVIHPGDGRSSILYIKISGSQFGPQMPPTGALRPEQIDIIKRWIDQGVPWPEPVKAVRAVDARVARLAEAFRGGDRAAIARGIAEKSIANLPGPDGRTPLMYAALN